MMKCFGCRLERATQMIEPLTGPALVRMPAQTDEYLASHGKDQA